MYFQLFGNVFFEAFLYFNSSLLRRYQKVPAFARLLLDTLNFTMKPRQRKSQPRVTKRKKKVRKGERKRKTRLIKREKFKKTKKKFQSERERPVV